MTKLNFILILAIIAIVLLPNRPVAADEFDGDKWTQNQLELNAEVSKCVKLLKKDIKLYIAACSGLDMTQRAKQQVMALSITLQKYPSGTTIEEFLNAEFTTPNIGQAAIASMYMTTTRLEYIMRMLQLEVVKAKAAGLRPA